MTERLRSGLIVGRALELDFHQLCSSGDSLEFRDNSGTTRQFTPDSTKGYFSFDFSFGFPVRNIYRTALHPNVISMSYQSLVGQYLNYEHKMKYYNKEIDDRIIGHIVAVNLNSKTSINSIQPELDTPYVSGVATFFKRCQGLSQILGQHVSGRHKWAVSMEVDWAMEECGFAVALKNGSKVVEPVFDFSPPDFLQAGFEYIPYESAPPELIATFSIKKNRVVANWKGREVTVLMGGLNNPVHYAGLALVKNGAEAPARINSLKASAETAPTLEESFSELAQIIGKGMTSSMVKKIPNT